MRAKKIATERSLHEGDKIGTARLPVNRNFSVRLWAVLKIIAALISDTSRYSIPTPANA